MNTVSLCGRESFQHYKDRDPPWVKLHRKRLAADFFVGADGVAIPRARPLKRSEARAIFERDGGRCQMCGKPVKFGGNSTSPFDRIASGAVDHIFPRARGGQNDPSNLQLACLTCNARKGAK